MAQFFHAYMRHHTTPKCQYTKQVTIHTIIVIFYTSHTTRSGSYTGANFTEDVSIMIQIRWKNRLDIIWFPPITSLNLKFGKFRILMRDYLNFQLFITMKKWLVKYTPQLSSRIARQIAAINPNIFTLQYRCRCLLLTYTCFITRQEGIGYLRWCKIGYPPPPKPALNSNLAKSRSCKTSIVVA